MMKLESWFRSDTGRVRKANQDYIGCYPDLRLFVVADGMGGRDEGEVASKLAVETLRDELEDVLDARWAQNGRRGLLKGLFGARDEQQIEIVDALRSVVRDANGKIFDAGQRRIEETGGSSMGTTVVVAAFSPDIDQMAWTYVGDSRLYLYRDGELALLTADHTMLGEAFRELEAVPVDLPHTNQLLRALGIRATVEVSGGCRGVMSGDVFLLCSDGLSGMLKANEIALALGESAASLESIGNNLIESALDAGGKDNASALLIRASDVR